MAFTDKQRRSLRAKLSYRHVKTRVNQGATIAYVEGWHAIAEANRIFGHDSWDRQTQSPHCVWSDTQRGQTVCCYSTKVRITVRAGATVTIREGIGTGFGRSASAEAAHEMALKAAETDATKRALATFGNPFGLALYDKDHTQVTKAPQDGAKAAKAGSSQVPGDHTAPLVLRLGDSHERSFDQADAFVAATLNAVTALPTIDDVYAFWEANLASFTALRARAAVSSDSDPVVAIVSALKGRVRFLGAASAPAARGGGNGVAVAPSALAIPKEKRVRDKDHLGFVAKQPCLICGRKPAHAHHLRFAQPRAMGLKVSDEFTVPLCNAHHDALHRTGDERAWWARHGIIEPLKFAARLWAASRLAEPVDDIEATTSTSPEPETRAETPGALPPTSNAAGTSA